MTNTRKKFLPDNVHRIGNFLIYDWVNGSTLYELNELELFNLQCWALTCETFFSKKEWFWTLNKFGYKGDLELIYF